MGGPELRPHATNLAINSPLSNRSLDRKLADKRRCIPFAEFFREELAVDIDDPRWEAQGGSKAKRLRYYLQQADRRTALHTLEAFWEYREASSVTEDCPELDDSVRTAYFRTIQRLGGRPPQPEVPAAAQQEPLVDPAATSALAARLLEVSTMDPQARGYPRYLPTRPAPAAERLSPAVEAPRSGRSPRPRGSRDGGASSRGSRPSSASSRSAPHVLAGLVDDPALKLRRHLVPPHVHVDRELLLGDAVMRQHLRAEGARDCLDVVAPGSHGRFLAPRLPTRQRT